MTRLNTFLISLIVSAVMLFIYVEIDNRHLRAQSEGLRSETLVMYEMLDAYVLALRECDQSYRTQIKAANRFFVAQGGV